MSGQEDTEAGPRAWAGGAAAPSPAEPFALVREALTGDPQLTLEDVASRAGLPLQVLHELFDATEWGDQAGYDERDVAYAEALAHVLDVFPLRSVVRMLRTRYRAMTSIVISDLGNVRDRVVMPALAGGADEAALAEQLGHTAHELLPLITEQLREDYRHVLLRLLDTEALAQGISPEGGRSIELAVAFVDIVGYTKLSGYVDPAALDHVLTGFEDLVTTAVAEASDVLLAKFIGDAAMMVGSDVGKLAGVLVDLCSSRNRLAEAPRRGGLACGRVLVRDGDYYGPIPNLAARLSDHARPWSVLADESLAGLLDDRFAVESISKTDLPGIGTRRPLRVRAGDQNGTP